MIPLTITDVRVLDLRFPTSRVSIGSDAVNRDPDYSAAYCILETDGDLKGYGLTFTLGRGNELCVQAIEFLSRFVVGRTISSITDDFAAFQREVTGDTQFRWLGSEKGVVHLAAGALVNAVWDLYARVEGKPLWQLLAEMEPEQIVQSIDFRYITDAITPKEALLLLQKQRTGYGERLALLKKNGYPAYTTSVGWFGFSDAKIKRLAVEALAQGWKNFKLKVGGNEADDLRRARLVRDEIGAECRLMADANQKWDVDEAIRRTKQLAEVDLWWMEEPTSPDDVLGCARIRKAVAPTKIATGEHCQNRVIFKQLFQAGAIDVCQIDSCRVAGVTENLAILLMAAKFGVPVCPHAGGVGLCEYVQHLSMFDYLRVSASMENRMIEFVDHLHEHFTDPVRIQNGHYMVPERPGYSIEMWKGTLEDYNFRDGKIWNEVRSPSKVLQR
ncbi:MAG: enolase C-terminal domain-like protein [Silvibacterium sp.]